MQALLKLWPDTQHMRDLIKVKAADLNGRIGHRGLRILHTGGWASTAKICAAINLFVCVPFVLEALGQRHFGAWAAVVSVITLSNFLDFGLGNGAMNLVAAAKGRHQTEEISEIIATAYVTLIKTTAVLTLSLVFLPFIPWHRLLGLPAQDAGISAVSIAIVVCAVLATIPLALANKLQLGLGIGGRSFRWQAAGQLLTAIVVISLAKTNHGLPALVAGSALVPVLALLMNTWDFLRTQPKSDHKYHSNSAIAKQIRHEGALFFMLQLFATLGFSLDLLIITSLSGAEKAASFSIIQRVFSLIPISLGLLWISLWPTYREALAIGHYSWVYRTFRKSTIIAFFYALISSIVITVFFALISNLWIEHSIDISMELIISFACWHIVEAVGTSIAMLMNAASIIRLQTIFVALFAFTSLALKAFLAANSHIEYIPMATSLTYLFFFVIPSFIFRKEISYWISTKIH